MHKDKLISDKTKQYLIQTDVKPGRFCILPKVHKPGSPGRRIVSSNSHPTVRISHFVDHHPQPLVHKLPSFVKDTSDFLNKLLTIGNLPANSLLVTLDVSSLYTNIPHNEGINACEHFLRTSSHNTIPTHTLCDLIRMILTMNNSLLMITTTSKSMAPPWVLKWPPLMLTSFWVISKQTLWKMLHSNPTFGCDISMIFL